MINFFKRHLLRSQMRETARRIDALRDHQRRLPDMIKDLKTEQAALPDLITQLEQRAAGLREDYFWLDRKPSAQACVGRTVR